jgi:putative ABC transport system permease protein
MTALVGRFSEAFQAASINLSSARARPSFSAIIVVGFATVVLVCVAVFSMGRGISLTLDRSGSSSVDIAYSAGADSEFGSTLTPEAVEALRSVLSTVPGGGYLSASLVSSFTALRESNRQPSNVVIRGVDGVALQVTPIHLLRGRMFRAGMREVIVGEQASGQFKDLKVGDKIEAGDGTWSITGIFTSDSGLDESEVWADINMVRSAFRAGPASSSTRIKLSSTGNTGTLLANVLADPRLRVKIETQRAYNRRLGRWVVALASTVGVMLGSLFALAAVIGAINVMDAVIAGRSRELATLRAMGFRRSSVFGGLLIEGATLGVIGGLFGSLIAYILFNGLQTSTINPAGFTQTAFRFAVTPDLICYAVIAALSMGALAAVAPAIGAARSVIAEALRRND